MDIKNSLHVVRAAFTVSARACARDEYMAECLAVFPFLSPEERANLGREYATVIRQDGIWRGSVKTLPSQTRLLARAARAALRGEPAWRLVGSHRAVEILREEAIAAGLIPDPLMARLRELDLRIEEAEAVQSRIPPWDMAYHDLGEVIHDLRVAREQLCPKFDDLN